MEEFYGRKLKEEIQYILVGKGDWEEGRVCWKIVIRKWGVTEVEKYTHFWWWFFGGTCEFYIQCIYGAIIAELSGVSVRDKMMWNWGTFLM